MNLDYSISNFTAGLSSKMCRMNDFKYIDCNWTVLIMPN